MDIKEFFCRNRYTVICEDHTETDQVIAICKEVGLPIYGSHDRYGSYIHPYWNKAAQHISFYCDAGIAPNAILFSDFMSMYYDQSDSIEVGDLL